MLSAVLGVSMAAPLSFVAPGAKVEKLAGGFQFTEGPCELPDGRLIFSDIPANKVYAMSGGKLADFRNPSGNANGNTLDRKGGVIACEHGSRSVTRWSSDGKVTTLASTYEGKKLNSPNDAWVAKNGRIYFTDPPYGIQGNQQELAFNGVYMIDKGRLTLLDRTFNRPNGIVLSLDQKTLYVADTAESHIKSFPVKADGTLGAGKVFAKTPDPDGIRIDSEGRIWSASGDGVNVIGKDGKVLEVIKVPEQPANLCFSRKAKYLYITARHGLYGVKVTVKGIAP